MPITITPQSKVRTEEYGYDPLESNFDGTYTFNAHDVTVIDSAINLMDVPENSVVELKLPEAQNKTLNVFVSAGTKVEVFGAKTFSRVRVIDSNGETHSGRNYTYISNTGQAGQNINAQSEFPDISGSETLEFGPYSMDNIEKDDHKIYCRHLAVAQLMMKKGVVKAPDGSVGWKQIRNYFHAHEDRFTKLFDSKKIWESIVQDAILGSPERYAFLRDDINKFCWSEFYELKQELDKTGQNQEKHYILHADTVLPDVAGHGLYINIQVKKEKDSEDVKYKLKIYDPNMSNTHISYTSSDCQHIMKLQVEELFPILDPNLDQFTMHKMEDAFPLIANSSVKGKIEKFRIVHDSKNNSQFALVTQVDKDYLGTLSYIAIDKDDDKQYTAWGTEVLPKDVK